MSVRNSLWSLTGVATRLVAPRLESKKLFENRTADNRGILKPSRMTIERQVITDFCGVIDVLALQRYRSPQIFYEARFNNEWDDEILRGVIQAVAISSEVDSASGRIATSVSNRGVSINASFFPTLEDNSRFVSGYNAVNASRGGSSVTGMYLRAISGVRAINKFLPKAFRRAGIEA